MLNAVEWSFENIVVGLCVVLYAAVSVTFIMKHNYPWAIVWGSYAMANVGMIIAQSK